MTKRHFRSHRPLYTNTLPKEVEKPKMRWKAFPIIWLGLKKAATVIGFIVLINIFMAILITSLITPKSSSAPSLPNEMVLFMELDEGFQELPSPATFADPFAPAAPTVRDIIDAIDHAREDDRVKGILARMYGGGFTISQVTEVRAALKRFREAGKFAHIYSSSYGEGGGGLGRYYLASAFDEIWMQPLGVVSIVGVNAEIPFFRGTLDKIGVQPQFFQRKEYKTAMESLTNSEMSAQNRETVQKIVNDIRFELLERIPQDRGMSAPEFERLVNKGLFTAPEAEKAGLITHMDYGDVLLDNIAEQVTGERDADKLELINLNGYIHTTKNKSQGLMSGLKPKIALVYAVGAIMPSSDGGGLNATEGIAAADVIAPAILRASKDESVAAIVLRIDSPGGSPAASESILRAVEKAQERGKPVVVSMGATAASGGYWIAAYADKIYALPTTLTGSIGVVGGKFAMGELFDKMGVNWEEVSWGKNSGLWSINSTFSEGEAERMNAMLDNVYENFVARVAKGRKMDVAAVDKIAGGRVWTGRRAIDVGLVDELGGLEDALDYVAQLNDKQSRNDLNVVLYPKPKNTFEQVLELLGTQARLGAKSVALQERFLGVFEPALDTVSMMEKPQNYITYEPLRLEQ